MWACLPFKSKSNPLCITWEIVGQTIDRHMTWLHVNLYRMAIYQNVHLRIATDPQYKNERATNNTDTLVIVQLQLRLCQLYAAL